MELEQRIQDKGQGRSHPRTYKGSASGALSALIGYLAGQSRQSGRVWRSRSLVVSVNSFQALGYRPISEA